jgi:hypothetical protein
VNRLRLHVLLLVIGLVACATKPPLPPECEGELVPINPVSSTATQGNSHAARSGS